MCNGVPSTLPGGGGGEESTNGSGQAIPLYCTTVCQPHHTAKVKVKLIRGGEYMSSASCAGDLPDLDMY